MAGNGSTMQTGAGILRGLPWIIVVASMIIGYRAVMPPAPLAEATPADQFSAARAATHVDSIAAEPHPMGSREIEDVRSYIATELESLGLDVDTQQVMRPSYFEDRTVPVVNLTARVRGSASSGTIALIGHYDTVPETPGANDNSSAVAALLETSRALLAGPPVRNDILLLFTDAEEPEPRYGAVAFVEQHPAFADIALVVNLEATGGHGASLLAETSGSDRWLVAQLGMIESRPAAFSFLTETGRLIGDIGTDFDEFRNADVSGFHFAYVQGSNIYHTPEDNIEALSLGSLQHHGDHVLGVSRHFGNLDLTIEHGEDRAVYFSLPPVLIAYPTTWAIPLMLLAVACVVAGFVRGRNRFGRSAIHKPGIGALVGLGAIIAGTLGWMAVVTVLPSLGFIQAYVAFSLIVSAACVGVGWANRRFRPTAVRGYGPLLPMLALTTLTAFVGVGFSYLFTLPMLAVGVALWMPDDDRSRYVGFSVVAVVTILLHVPFVDTFVHFAGPRPGNPGSNMPAAIVLPLAVALLTIGTLRSFWPIESTDED